MVSNEERLSKVSKVSPEERQTIVNAVKTLYGSLGDFRFLYLDLVKLLRNYSFMAAEHDNSFGELSKEDVSKDLYTIETLMRKLESLVEVDFYTLEYMESDD